MYMRKCMHLADKYMYNPHLCMTAFIRTFKFYALEIFSTNSEFVGPYFVYSSGNGFCMKYRIEDWVWSFHHQQRCCQVRNQSVHLQQWGLSQTQPPQKIVIWIASDLCIVIGLEMTIEGVISHDNLYSGPTVLDYWAATFRAVKRAYKDEQFRKYRCIKEIIAILSPRLISWIDFPTLLNCSVMSVVGGASRVTCPRTPHV